MVGNPDGPAWLGIGAQRSGTSWFTSLLTQHPHVSLGRSGRKELHAFNAELISGRLPDESYHAEFCDLPGKPGEFTPAYLRMLWVPELARRACRRDVVVVVLLRDPVDRFESAMRLFLADQLPRRRAPLANWARDKGVDATWAGMYAHHLNAWASSFPREQIVVLQYERLVLDPAAAVGRVWDALELEPAEFSDTNERGLRTRPEWSLRDHPELRTRLVDLYRHGVDRVTSEWDVDRSLWANFRD